MLRCVATDGHRLARIDADLPEGAADMPGVIVPRKTVGELRKLLDAIRHEVLPTIDQWADTSHIRIAREKLKGVLDLLLNSNPPFTSPLPSEENWDGNDHRWLFDQANQNSVARMPIPKSKQG